MKQNRRILQSLKKEKENIQQLIVTSVLIAIGVDSFATGLLISLGLDQKAKILVIVGAALSLGAILYFLLSGVSKLDKDVKFSGFLIYDNKTKELLPVSRYEISEDMVRYLNAAFVENKALKKLWDSESIRIMRRRSPQVSTGTLLIELIEYCIIEELSLHLSAYFNNSDNLKAVEEFSQKDIPDILLDNRFLKLFSEDMQNRELFADSNDERIPTKGRVVAAYHPSGAIYKEFDLILPAKSKVRRISKNQIVIETNMFSLSICCLFEGFNTNLPRSFEKDYLHIHKRQNIHAYKFDVGISVKFKIRSFFLANKWDYYVWADDFIERIYNYISKDAYFTKINWETVSTLLRCRSIVLAGSKQGIHNQSTAE